MLIDVIGLELIQNNQDEKLEENLLTEEHEGQPEEDIVGWDAVRAIAFGVALSGREKHIQIPILAR